MALDNSVLFDTADAVFYGPNTYDTALSALQVVWGKSRTATELSLNAQYGAMDFNTAVEALKDAGVTYSRNANGAYGFGYTNATSVNIPTPTSAINSNASTTAVVQATPVIDTAVDSQTGKVAASTLSKTISGANWQYYAVSAGQALAAAGVGISLGKSIDSVLYNANPAFWDKNNMQALNPETWSSITNGDDSFAATLFNMILGIQPDSGKAQLLIDENAYAYLAQYMSSNGVFAPTSTTYDASAYMTDNPTTMYGYSSSWIEFPTSMETIAYRRNSYGNYTFYYHQSFTSNALGSFIFAPSYSDESWSMVLYSNQPIIRTITNYDINGNITTVETETTTSQDPTGWYYKIITVGKNVEGGTYQYARSPNPYDMQPIYYDVSHRPVNYAPAIKLVYDNVTPAYAGGIDGISTQTGATTPNVSGWNTPQDTLTSLQTQYPDLWAQAVPNTVVQPDGTVKTVNYIPIPIPTSTGQYDVQPTTGTQTQTDTIINPLTATAEQLKTILQLITQPIPNPYIDTQTMPQPEPNTPNPPTTGEGGSPTPIPATGAASALWSVYHPSAAEINAFGAWLWTDNVIQQFVQLLNNPMEGIITLHKVFVTPTDATTSTIVVGRLDSQISSATVAQQYEYLDCGSINLSEYFGTVFDYNPYTSISLYLPFIGFVTLNPDDVMRSTINVVYGVDLFTGACLATVNVTRDGFTVGMYEYTGVASVEYPLTGAQHGGLVNGLLGIGGGVAGIAMASTGVGMVAGASAIAGGLTNFNKSNPARSGGFSGNAGAMGCKIPYLVIERPQTKIADFSELRGFPTNESGTLSEFSGNVIVEDVHVEGIAATDKELSMIENALHSGVLI